MRRAPLVPGPGTPSRRVHVHRALGTLSLVVATLAVLAAPTAPGIRVEASERRWLAGASLHADLREHIASARERILVVLFLMSSSDVADHPVRRLIGDLAAAHDRGVDVMVILDEMFLEKNRTAYRQLEDAGIDVRWDDPDRLTHTKLVVVDDDAWVGSANWTTSALTGGNIESTVRVRSRALADRLYAIRTHYLNRAESRASAEAAAALAAEARAALAGPDGGPLRRELAASGLDLTALIDAGLGATVGDPAMFRTRTLARLGMGTGWARWDYPPVAANMLILPTRSGRILAVSTEDWRVLYGSADEIAENPALLPLAGRLLKDAPTQ